MVWSEFDACYDLPAYSGPRRTYLIATTQRTGSHFLAHLLGARGIIGVPFEYLNDHRVLLELRSRGLQPTEETETELLREMRQRRTGSSGWFGLKAHWHTWTATLSRPLVAAEVDPVAYIYLRRRDRIAQAASLALAQQTGWWVDESQNTGMQPTYSFTDIRKALTVIDAENAAWQRFFTNGRTYLELHYEELVADPDRAVTAVCSHLGVGETGTHNPQFPTMKARQDDIADDWAERFRSEIGA